MKKKSATRKKLLAMKVLLALSLISFLSVAVINTASLLHHFYPVSDCTGGKERLRVSINNFQIEA